MSGAARSIFDLVATPLGQKKKHVQQTEQPHDEDATKASETTFTIPSVLNGPPIAAYVPPGSCQFNENPVAVQLLKRTLVSDNTAVLRFNLPNEKEPLNLSTSACILAKSNIKGEDVVRPYTPISTNDSVGCFDLLVKSYGDHGKMSRHLHEIPEGSTDISFFHIPFNVKIQAPDFLKYREILMLVGGSGITPMIQALHAILGSNYDGGKVSGPKVTLLYGCRTRADILGRRMLDNWKTLHPNQLKVEYILSQEYTSEWNGLRGHIDGSLIQKHFPNKNEQLQVWICGPPPMYKALSGPREESDKVSGVLAELGYTAEQVFKF